MVEGFTYQPLSAAQLTRASSGFSANARSSAIHLRLSRLRKAYRISVDWLQILQLEADVGVVRR
jgi:hypothetical protein